MRLVAEIRILDKSDANIVLLFESAILFCDFFCDFIAKYGDGFDVRRAHSGYRFVRVSTCCKISMSYFLPKVWRFRKLLLLLCDKITEL